MKRSVREGKECDVIIPVTIKPEYPVLHYHYNWPVKIKPRKSSETSSSANLSHKPWGYPKTKAYNIQFGLQIPCTPVTKRHVKHGNAVWLMWRRSGRWWLEHDLPATIEVYPSSFFLFQRERESEREKTPYFATPPLTSPQTTTWNLWITALPGRKLFQGLARCQGSVRYHVVVSSKEKWKREKGLWS